MVGKRLSRRKPRRISRKGVRARINSLADVIARAAGLAAEQAVREVMRKEGAPASPRALQMDIGRSVRSAALPAITRTLAKYYD